MEVVSMKMVLPENQSAAYVRTKYNKRRHFHATVTNLLFMLPAFVLFAYVVLVPFIQGIPYSFTNWKSIIGGTKSFVGFKNYATMLRNQYFIKSFGHTLEFTVIYEIGANLLGLLFALLLWRSSLFSNFCRTMLFLPFTTSLVSAALVWNYVFQDVYTPLFNKPSPLGISGQVVAGLAVIAIWRDMGYCMLIYIAGLQAIPEDYYEAAKVEGASGFQIFRKITLPLLVPAFTSNVTLLLAWGLKCFDYPMAAARNMQSAQTTAMFIYDYIFGYSKAGLGQAAAVILTIVLILATRVVTYFFRKAEVQA
jgi:raffinose/stachyose/melibiose transport system permease protein